MYRKTIRSWIKHADFILLDLGSLLVALSLAYWVGKNLGHPFITTNPVSFTAMLLLLDLAVIITFNTFDCVVTRGYLVEVGSTLRHEMILLALSVIAVLIRTDNTVYPQITFVVAGVLYYLFSYSSRVAWKRFLRKHPGSVTSKRKILVVTDSDHAPEILDRMRRYSFVRYQLVGLVLADRDAKDETIEDTKVVANISDAADFLCREWVDEVFFFHASNDARAKVLLEQCRQMALTIHLYVAIEGVDERKQMIDYIAGYEVLTANVNLMSPKDAYIKRCFDIAAGLLGSLIAALLLLTLGPFLYAASPGPILFRQERIGENGRKFTMYKIRSMYLDAEERKAAYMTESTHMDGMMFKMDFDPRVIGNHVLPDGRKKKGIGAFIRDTGLDEFPQFFNVLKGDMSIVGTRPPTPDEWERYQYRHRSRMSVKPGVTGLWQIRSDKDYMSFDEVVRLDTEYIAHWGLGLDARIVLTTAWKTILALFSFKKKERVETESDHTNGTTE